MGRANIEQEIKQNVSDLLRLSTELDSGISECGFTHLTLENLEVLKNLIDSSLEVTSIFKLGYLGDDVSRLVNLD